MSSSSSPMDALKYIEDELARLGLRQTLETLKNEASATASGSEKYAREAVSGIEESCSQPLPILESSKSEPHLAPLAVAQPVYSEAPPLLLHRHSMDSAVVKSPSRTRKATPQFVVVPVFDQEEFKAMELPNKALPERTNYEEYPATPVCFSARSSTSKGSTSDPPTSAPCYKTSQNPFTWDAVEKSNSELDLLPSPLLEFPRRLKNAAPDGPGLSSEEPLDSPIKMDRSESFSRVDSLNNSKEVSEAIANLTSGDVSDLADEAEDNATIVSLPDSDTSPFAVDFVFAQPEAPLDLFPCITDEQKPFSFPQTPQGSDAGSGGGLNVLKSFSSTPSTEFLSCGTNSSKTAKTPFGLELSTGSLSSRMDISQSSGEMSSPNGSEALPALPLLLNSIGTEKRVSLSLNACGYDWDSILNDIKTSKTQRNMPLDTFPEELWMNKESSKDKTAECLLPRYKFSQSYIDETYDLIDLKIYHKRGKTGFESHKDLYVEMGDIIAGRYQVIKVVGSAVFSKAIKAVDLKLNTSVCLKMVKNVKDYFDQSLDEIKLLRYLNIKDPNDDRGIVRLLDFFYYREHLFLVFELLRQNLYEVQQKSIKETGSVAVAGYYFSKTRMRSIAQQILVALRFLHSKNIIHSDLKPENVLVKDMEACTVKVIDLGSSCFVTDFLGSYVQSRSYRAPEVILGVEYDQKIDIWSLGCLLVELFTGSVLFQSSGLTELLAKIESVCGSMPSWMIYQGKFSTKYYTTSLKIYRKNTSTHDYEILSPIPCDLSLILKKADESFVSFVSSLLTPDPNKRPNAEEMLRHPWLLS